LAQAQEPLLAHKHPTNKQVQTTTAMQTLLAIVVGCFYADATQLSFAVPLAKALPEGYSRVAGAAVAPPTLPWKASSENNGLFSGNAPDTTYLKAAAGGLQRRVAADVANEPMCKAAMKASHFRRLRQELRAQRVRKGALTQKLERLKELERQHLVTKARITYHQPKVALRNAKTYLDAALEKLARDMANSKKELRMTDQAIQNLRVEHAGIVAKQQQIQRSDAALVININVDHEEEARLAGLINLESVLKKGVDEHRMVAVGDLRAKVANSRVLQDELQAQLANTMDQKLHLTNKLAAENEKEQYFEVDKMALEKKVAACQSRVQTLESDLAKQNMKLGKYKLHEKSQAYEQLQQEHEEASQELAEASAEYHFKYDDTELEALRQPRDGRPSSSFSKDDKAAGGATGFPTGPLPVAKQSVIAEVPTDKKAQFSELSGADTDVLIGVLDDTMKKKETDAEKEAEAEREELEEAEMEHANLEQYEQKATQELQPETAFLEKSSKRVLSKRDAKFANTPALFAMREKVSKAVMMIMS